MNVAPRNRAGLRVLLVEDDESQRHTLSDILRDEGYDPVACADVDQALELADGEEFAVAIVDQRLPGHSGIDFLEQLRERRAGLRVVINTGYGSFDSAKQSVNLGAFAYVEKAGDPQELLWHVDRAAREYIREALRDTEEQLRLVTDNVPVLLAHADGDLRYRFMNRRYREFFGCDPERVIGQHVSEVIGLEAFRSIEVELRVALSGRQVRLERPVDPTQPETCRWLDVTYVPHRDESGTITGLFSMATDITERRRAEKAMRDSEERFQSLYDNAPDIYFTVDDQARVLSVNQFGVDYLGFGKDDLVGTELWKVVHPDDVTMVRGQLNELFETGKQESELEFRMLQESGGVLWVHQRARVGRDGPERRLEVRMVCRDITEAHDLSEELSYQATHDALTGLVNRRELESRLARVLATARADGSEHALCYLDLDQFKLINDTCGHVAGDELLRQLGELLPTRVRRRDTLARLGGDEFAVLMEHCSLMQAGRVAHALRSAVEEFRFIWRDRSFNIGVSIGLVPISVSSESVGAVLSAADTACYVAKDRGRNRIHVYQEDDAELARRHGEMEWVGRIHRALEEGRFRLSYQPIVPVDDGRRRQPDEQGLYFELLLRMEDEDGQLVPPGAFLPAAERYGLAARIDRWVVEHAFRWLASRELDDVYLCSINLSGRSLADEEFRRFMVSKLDSSGIPGDKICLEITETSVIADLTSATRFISALREYGCRFALDDFGSGLSSFAYLKHLPVDFLKIDGVFVKDIVFDPIDLAMVKSINDIGRVMGKHTVAEFVESGEVLAKLRELGVDYAQGYGVGRPQPIENLPAAKVVDRK